MVRAGLENETRLVREDLGLGVREGRTGSFRTARKHEEASGYRDKAQDRKGRVWPII